MNFLSHSLVNWFESSSCLRRNWLQGRRIKWLPRPVRQLIFERLQHFYHSCMKANPDPYRRRAMNRTLNDFERINQSATVLSFPRIVYVELTHRCNSYCFMCPHTFETFNTVEIDDTIFDRLLQWLDVCDELWFNGLGEMLLYPRIFDFFQKIPPWIPTGLHSNGVLLTEETANKLLSRPLDLLRVSIDAPTPELYADIRGIDALPLVKKNLFNLQKIKHSLGIKQPRIEICMTLMKRNLHCLNDMVRLSSELGIQYLNVSRLTVYHQSYLGESPWWFKRLYNEKLEEARELGTQMGVTICGQDKFDPNHLDQTEFTPTQRRPPCMSPWLFMNVWNTGEVSGCTFPAPMLGNLNHQSAGEIWNGARFKKWRETVNSEDNPIEFCQHCPNHHHQCGENSNQMFVVLDQLQKWQDWEPAEAS